VRGLINGEIKISFPVFLVFLLSEENSENSILHYYRRSWVVLIRPNCLKEDYCVACMGARHAVLSSGCEVFLRCIT